MRPGKAASMATSAEVQELILDQLSRGPHGPYAIAAAIGEPPFRVRAELKELKRHQLVREQLNPQAHLFHLTASGVARIAGHRQMRLVG